MNKTRVNRSSVWYFKQRALPLAVACVLSAFGGAGDAQAGQSATAVDTSEKQQAGRGRHADAYNIGVYYYPGWQRNQHKKAGWDEIVSYASERMPLLGWYDEGAPEVMDEQLAWMRTHAIDFVVFDWYWSRTAGGRDAAGQPIGAPYLDHALRGYLQAPNREHVKFSLAWAVSEIKESPDSAPASNEEFDKMVQLWIDRYFKSEHYQKVDGKPMLTILSISNFAGASERANPNAEIKTKTWLDRAQRIARQNGLPGIYFVGGAYANSDGAKKAAALGYDALSVYNMHGPYQGYEFPSNDPALKLQGGMSTSYKGLDTSYQTHWDWFMDKSNTSLPYILPMTSGWNKTPWGGTYEKRQKLNQDGKPAYEDGKPVYEIIKHELHDRSVSTPSTFEAHLRAAKQRMDKHPDKTLRMGVICCWNEYGEGSYIEPTQRWQMQYLGAVRSVFSHR